MLGFLSSVANAFSIVAQLWEYISNIKKKKMSHINPWMWVWVLAIFLSTVDLVTEDQLNQYFLFSKEKH